MPIAAQRVVTWRFGEGRDARGNTAIVSSFGQVSRNRFNGVYNAGEREPRPNVGEERSMSAS